MTAAARAGAILTLRLLALAAVLSPAPPAAALDLARADGALRVATFNAALNRRGAGVLLKQASDGRHKQILAVAEIIQRVRPDILLINEFDYDREGLALAAFAALLAEGERPIAYPHRFSAPSNTGVPSGFDLDGDGAVKGPGDAFGYGEFPGQYGMAVLSVFPIDRAETRTFAEFPWSAMPGALLPADYYGDAAGALRLSSKSHWDVAVDLPGGRRLRLLASHPTPPVFDGPEDRNGRRNHDEIRFWSDYIEGQDYFVDDAGGRGGMRAADGFVILGDLNADPEDGDGRREAIRRLLAHPAVQDPRPASEGALAAAGEGVNARHKGDPALDTADWNDARGPGNLRADFVLPSSGWEVAGAGVFWPAPGDPLHRLIGGKRPASSDHRLVWVDLR